MQPAITNVSASSRLSETSSGEDCASLQELLEEDRSFNIDIHPKLIYCSGEMVQALVQSGVCKYLEFKSIERTLLYIDNEFQDVPCSKSDVFKSKFISLLEKRCLMKFLQFCLSVSASLEDSNGAPERAKSTEASQAPQEDADALPEKKKEQDEGIRNVVEGTITFRELLQSQSLSSKLQRFLLDSIVFQHVTPSKG